LIAPNQASGVSNVSEGGPLRAEGNRRIEQLLADYAAGVLSEPFAVLVAAHLQIEAGPRGLAASIPPTTSAIEEMNALMPLALRHYVNRHLGGSLAWRTLLPGLQQCVVAREGDTQARFLRCRPGKAIPAHTHVGREATLVLQGGFHDASGDYVRGDIAVSDQTVDHRPVADRSGECIIFLVHEGPVRLTGPLGRFWQRLKSAYAFSERAPPV
jgi:putative transcriptional regulator